MVSIDKASIARIKIKNQVFEILVDAEKALEFRSGKNLSLNEILAINEVFKDAKKGERVPTETLKKVFGSDDVNEIAKKILKEGEIQIPAELKRKLIEEKKKEIASLISKKFVNPQNNLPHPPQRILNAMEQAGVNIDPFKPAEMQIESVINKIKKILPLKIEESILNVIIPISFASKIYNKIKSYGSILEENWGENLYVKIKINNAIKNEFIAFLSKYNAEIKEDVKR